MKRNVITDWLILSIFRLKSCNYLQTLFLSIPIEIGNLFELDTNSKMLFLNKKYFLQHWLKAPESGFLLLVITKFCWVWHRMWMLGTKSCILARNVWNWIFRWKNNDILVSLLEIPMWKHNFWAFLYRWMRRTKVFLQHSSTNILAKKKFCHSIFGTSP